MVPQKNLSKKTRFGYVISVTSFVYVALDASSSMLHTDVALFIDRPPWLQNEIMIKKIHNN